MRVCHCTGATDRDVRSGKYQLGKCGGCAPLVRELREAVPKCWDCGRGAPDGHTLLGMPWCRSCILLGDTRQYGRALDERKRRDELLRPATQEHPLHEATRQAVESLPILLRNTTKED